MRRTNHRFFHVCPPHVPSQLHTSATNKHDLRRTFRRSPFFQRYPVLSTVSSCAPRASRLRTSPAHPSICLPFRPDAHTHPQRTTAGCGGRVPGARVHVALPRPVLCAHRRVAPLRPAAPARARVRRAARLHRPGPLPVRPSHGHALIPRAHLSISHVAFDAAAATSISARWIGETLELTLDDAAHI